MAEQRLIDANNLIEEIREERCYNCRNFKDMKCDYCGTADYIYMIEDMPAADVEPVRHGRWIASHDEFCACSICKYPFYVGWNQANYCPNCGCRMDGGDDE